jgi:hypothetical protein
MRYLLFFLSKLFQVHQLQYWMSWVCNLLWNHRYKALWKLRNIVPLVSFMLLLRYWLYWMRYRFRSELIGRMHCLQYTVLKLLNMHFLRHRMHQLHSRLWKEQYWLVLTMHDILLRLRSLRLLRYWLHTMHGRCQHPPDKQRMQKMHVNRSRMCNLPTKQRHLRYRL